MLGPFGARGLIAFALMIGMIATTLGCGDGNAPPRFETGAPDLSRVDPVIAEHLDADRQRVLDTVNAGELSNDEAGEAVGKLGMVYQAYGLEGPAVECYRYSMVAQPEKSRWPYLLGRVELDRGDLGAALGHLEAAARLDPSDTPSAFYVGVALQNSGDPKTAATWYREAIERDANCAAAHYRLAQVKTEDHNLEDAVEAYLMVLELQPGATRIHAALAALYRRLGDEASAESHLAQTGDGSVKLIDPVMGEVTLLSLSTSELLNRGGKAFSQQRYREALVWFQRAAEMAPDDADVRIGLGSALLNLGKVDEARREFETAISIAPMNSRAHFNLGTLLAGAGDDSAAIGEYRAAVGIDPGYTAAHLNLGNALLRVGEYKTAAAHFETVNRQDQGRPSTRLAETVALSLAGDWARAADRIETAHRLFPQDRAIAAGLARLLAACPEDGLRDGPRSVRLSEGLIGVSSELDAVEALAMAYAEVGRFDDAVEAQTKAFDAVKRVDRADLQRVMESNLELYSNGQPCREPWSPSAL